MRQYFFYFNIWGACFYLVLAGYGGYLLYNSRTGESLLTPWQTINPAYIYVFGAATFILGLLVFFRQLSVGVLLGLLVVHYALLLSYLPLTHVFPYGADQWRHIAVERRLLSDQPRVLPVRPGGGGPLALEMGDFAYSGLWGATALVAKVFSLNLITVNKWLGPIVWAAAFPLLLFYLVRALGLDARAALSSVWLSALPFALTATGALTLPASFGFLLWLGGLILVINRLRQPNVWSLAWLGGWAVLLLFNHTLYFILFLLTWGAGEVILKIKNSSSVHATPGRQESIIKWLTTAGLIVLMAGTLLTVERLGGYSAWRLDFKWWESVKQAVGNFIGWYLASGPRPHDILTGNIIFNQAPEAAFVPNWLTRWRWWIPLFMLFWWGSVAVGARRAWQKEDEGWRLILIITLGATASYLVARYGLGGEQVINRRLDPALAFGYLVCFVLALDNWRQWFSSRFSRYNSLGQAVIVIIMSAAIATSYSLGPDARAVSGDEYRAVQYIWQEDRGEERHCVLADTYPLLALEALSAKAVVGGGFPINEYFAQPERVALYERLQNSVDPAVWRAARQLTGARHCWFVGSGNSLHEWQWFRLGLLTPVDIKTFGKITVWRYNDNP